MLLFLTGRLVHQSSGKIQSALSGRCHFCQLNVVNLSALGFRQQSAVNLRHFTRDTTKLKNLGKKNFKTKAKQEEKLSELRRLFGLASSEKWRLASAIALLTVSSGVTMSVPFIIGKVIDKMYTEDKSEMKDRIKQVSLAMLCIFFIGGACNFGRIYLMNTTAYRITQTLRKKVYAAILRQETAMFDRVSTGELVGRLTGDAQLVSSSITSNVSDGLRSGIMSMACVSMMIYISPKLATVCILIIPPLSVLSILYGRFVKRMTKNVQDSLAVLNSTAEEKISNIRVVKAFGKEINEINIYELKLQDLMDLCTKESLYRGLFFGAAGFFGNVMALSVLCYGGFMVSDETMTIGNLSSFLLYAAYMGFSLNGISSFYTELNRALGASTRLFELIDRQGALPIQGGRVLDKLDGQISFEDLTFAYPTRKDVLIFNNFNLVVPKCSTMAIVGQSGSGKSTVAALLLRLYDPDSGRILLDGNEIKELDPLWLKSQFGLVSQEAILFNGTIRENIMYGKEDATEKQVMDVVEQANVLEFVKRLPQGLDTLVGERGSSDAGLTDDLSSLSPKQVVQLTDWTSFYDKTYIYKGKLKGRFYDENGNPTREYDEIIKKSEQGKELKMKEEMKNTIFPPCNIEWKAETGTRVWCTKQSGGVSRDWTGVPRILFEKPNSKVNRCACVKINSDEYQENKAIFGTYQDCLPDATSCTVKI